jgi:hypothetical protein
LTACYVNSDGTCGPRLPAGWYLTGSNTSCGVSGGTLSSAYNIPPGQSATCWDNVSQAAVNAITATGAQLVQLDAGYTHQACCTVRWPAHEWYIPLASMPPHS